MQTDEARITLADALKKGETEFVQLSKEAQQLFTRIGGEAHAV